MNSTERLARALSRYRPKRAPLDLAPSTPFEQALLTRLTELEKDLDRLSNQVDRLTWVILGSFLAFVVAQLLG